jgi:hypothetical protein
MSKRVVVHHFVANLTIRQYGPGQRTSDLLDVNYWREVPPDTEFPRVFGRLGLFTRFYLYDARTVDYFVRVWWDDTPRPRPELVGEYGPFPTAFRPDVLVRDRVFRLHNVQLRGVGRYTVRLVRLRPASVWKRSRWAVASETHFIVERGS